MLREVMAKERDLKQSLTKELPTTFPNLLQANAFFLDLWVLIFLKLPPPASCNSTCTKCRSTLK